MALIIGHKINDDEAKKQIIDNLPSWKTKMIYMKEIDSSMSFLFQFKFFVNAKTIEDVQAWLQEYQDNTFTTYRIRNSIKGSGQKLICKKLLKCHHNSTYISKVKNLKFRRKTKNTLCPSTITIKLFSKSKNFDKYDMNCEITLIPNHNHETTSADILKHRPVDSSIKDKIYKLFECGYGPKSALEYINMDISLNYKNPEEVLMDGKFCPNYNYYLHLYQVFKKDVSTKNDKDIKCDKKEDGIKVENTVLEDIKYQELNDITCTNKTMEQEKCCISKNRTTTHENPDMKKCSELDVPNVSKQLNTLGDIVNNLNISDTEISSDNHLEQFEHEDSEIMESSEIILTDNNLSIENEKVFMHCEGGVDIYNSNRAVDNNLNLKIVLNKLKTFLSEDPNEIVNYLQMFYDKICTIESKLDYSKCSNR